MSVDPDVVIVGAGTAGLAAARTLLDAGYDITVLEAKDRIGGRAFTDHASLGIAWDQGAHWLHDQGRNYFAGYAESEGISLEPVAESRYLRHRGGWADDGVIRDYESYCDLMFDRILRLGSGEQDSSVATALIDHPFYRPMFESWYAALSGMEPDRSSAIDDYRYRDDTGNRRVRMGYGALVERYGAGIPVTRSTPVSRIDTTGPRVAVETAAGTVSARIVIITVSNSVLASGDIKFAPGLPEEFGQALEAVRLGEAEKVAFTFEGDVFGIEEDALFSFVHTTPQTARFQIRPFGENIAVAYMAGRFAREIAEAGEAAMADFALGQLVDAFGADIRSRVSGMTATQWCVDPFIGGGYSSARPGGADARLVLSEPIAERLYFAGEAHWLDAYGTVHGAYNSGVETATRVIEQLE